MSSASSSGKSITHPAQARAAFDAESFLRRTRDDADESADEEEDGEEQEDEESDEEDE